MNFKINKEKFVTFLEVTKAINKSFDLIPILYGSLGLYRIIGNFSEAHDVDILVPDKFIHQAWNSLITLMQKLNFALKDEHEHEFVRNQKLVAFGREEDLAKILQIDTKKLKMSEVEEVKFRELSVEQYLSVYRLMLRDNYRQEKRGGADREKIALIEKYLKEHALIRKEPKN